MSNVKLCAKCKKKRVVVVCHACVVEGRLNSN